MLRGPRKYGTLKSQYRSSSRASSRRKSFASTVGSFREGIAEGEETEEDKSLPKSPFLAGVSVTRFWLIFSGILVSYFVACFDGTIMVSSHPIITSYFESSNSASWLSTAFLLTSTSFQPLFGRLSDTIGRKPPYVFTMVVFLVSTVWCGLAQSMMSFIFARAVCGLGAGGMMTMGSIITSDLVPIEIRGAYQSYINIIFGVGSALGAALGGAIADHLGWRWEFGIQIPALVACLCIACFTVPRDLGLPKGVKKKSLREAMRIFDFKGSILLTLSITFLILGLVTPLPTLHNVSY
jgi:MFS family permease